MDDTVAGKLEIRINQVRGTGKHAGEWKERDHK